MQSLPPQSAESYRLPSRVTERLVSPALVVHLDLVRANVARVLELLGGAPERWRPHVKTTKTPAIWRELTRAGVRHFKCATAREAEYLAQHLEAEEVEGGDVLLAYPRLGPELAHLGELAAAHPRVTFSVVSESTEHLAEVPPSVSVFLDVNPGMNRTGVPLSDRAALVSLAQAAGERLRGLHVYDGQRHEPDQRERKRLTLACYDEVGELLDELFALGLPVGEVITAGTPAFLGACGYRGFERHAGLVHRLSPGTVVLHDGRSQQETPELGLVPAAVVFTRVVSHPAPGLVTCDAGSKSVAAEAGDPIAWVLGYPGLVAQPPSEEHLPLRVESGDAPPRGAELYLVPRHVCPTVNLAEACLLVDSGEVLGSAPIAARAHDLLR